jgi:8-oxo-dGTP diphosphatase
MLEEISKLPEAPVAIGGLTVGTDFVTAAVLVRARQNRSIARYALGELGPTDLPLAWRSGAQGIAAIRGLWSGLGGEG